MSVTSDGNLLVDHQGDQIPPDEIEKAAYQMIPDGAVYGDVNHDERDISELVELMVITPQKLDLLLKALGSDARIPSFKGVGLWVGYRIRKNPRGDEVWSRVKSGELKAFSIEARAERVPADETEE